MKFHFRKKRMQSLNPKGKAKGERKMAKAKKDGGRSAVEYGKTTSNRGQRAHQGIDPANAAKRVPKTEAGNLPIQLMLESLVRRGGF